MYIHIHTHTQYYLCHTHASLYNTEFYMRDVETGVRVCAALGNSGWL